MEFTFETHYNTKSLAIMAKALRKTVRKKHSRRSHIIGWLVIALSLLLLLSQGFVLDFRAVVTLLAVLAIFFALLFEDSLNGYLAKKRMLPGTEKAVSVFTESGFSSESDIGRTEWNYEKITVIAETADFFVFIFSANHAQLYDKNSIEGGTPEEFAAFLEKLTEKKIIKV